MKSPLKASLPARVDVYEHDQITGEELADLLGQGTVQALSPLNAPTKKDQALEVLPTKEIEEDELASRQGPSIPAALTDSPATPGVSDNSQHNVTNPAHVKDVSEQVETQTSQNTDDWELAFPLDPVLLDVPQAEIEIPFDEIDIGVREEAEDESDYEPEITQEIRARQLATAFLASIDELNMRHVDWITDIILARRWSSSQRQVTELWKSGLSLKAIYLAFQLSQHWRDCDCFDERHGDRFYRRPNLSWLDAGKLIAFYGQDCSVDEIAIFIDFERHLWRQSALLVSRYRFKEYLLRYRISDECRHPDLGWYRPLDPKDGRFFDGSANPEYTSEWWEDDPPLMHSPRHTSRRIYMGDLLDDLIPDSDDGLQWLGKAHGS